MEKRIETARERAKALSLRCKDVVRAVRVGTICGPTTRSEGWDQLFGAYQDGNEV